MGGRGVPEGRGASRVWQQDVPQVIGCKRCSGCGLFSAKEVQGTDYCQQEVFRMWRIVSKRCSGFGLLSATDVQGEGVLSARGFRGVKDSKRGKQ